MKSRYPFIRRALGALLAFALLLSCLPALAEGGIASWVNSDMEGTVTSRSNPSLKDDYHAAVNYRWLSRTAIPWGAFEASSFADRVSDVYFQKYLLMRSDSLTGHDAELVRKLRDLALDWDTRNALGVEPLRTYVEDIESIRTLDGLTDYMTTSRNAFLLDPSGYDVVPDPEKADRYVTCLDPVPLILGDSKEYEELSDYGELQLDLAEKSMCLLLERLGYSPDEARRKFENVIAFESLVAPFILSAEDYSTADYLTSTLNFYDREGLAALCSPFPMPAILDLSGAGASERFWVTEPDCYRAMGELYTEENVPLIKDWLIYYLLSFFGNAMDWDTCFTLEEYVMEASGVSGSPDDEDLALDMLETYLPVPMDNLYIQSHCTEETRRDILAIIDEVIVHYRAMLENEAWLSPETREKAVEKLDHLRVHAVYPDTLGDWSQVDFKGKEEGGTLLEALRKLYLYSVASVCGRTNQPVNRGEWDQAACPASEVNAFFDNTDNSITIAAGLLGGEFYASDMSMEEKLGSIGIVVAHEIGHAFDISGAVYDMDGNIGCWWTDEDFSAYQAKAEKLSAYYDRFVPYEGGAYSGNRVQQEAIADMAAMKCILAIAREQDGFDYDAFFRQYARLWRTKMRANAMIVTVAEDDHPLGCLRTNVTVQQFDEFYETYRIGPGDGMYLAPEDRIAIW